MTIHDLKQEVPMDAQISSKHGNHLPEVFIDFKEGMYIPTGFPLFWMAMVGMKTTMP